MRAAHRGGDHGVEDVSAATAVDRPILGRTTLAVPRRLWLTLGGGHQGLALVGARQASGPPELLTPAPAPTDPVGSWALHR